MKTAYCFDLDGTVTRDEILPVLSRHIGLYDEIEALTQATINGYIPFNSSFKLRVRLLSEIPISTVRDIIAKVPLYKKTSEFIQAHKDQCFLITGNLDCWIQGLVDKLGLRAFTSISKREGDKLLGIEKILNKGDAVDAIRAMGFEKIVAVGDGMGDVPMFERADVGIAYSGVHSPVRTLKELSNFIVFNEEALCRTLNTL